MPWKWRKSYSRPPSSPCPGGKRPRGAGVVGGGWESRLARKAKNWCEAGLLPPGVTQLGNAFKRGGNTASVVPEGEGAEMAPQPYPSPSTSSPGPHVLSLPPTSQLNGRTHIYCRYHFTWRCRLLRPQPPTLWCLPALGSSGGAPRSPGLRYHCLSLPGPRTTWTPRWSCPPSPPLSFFFNFLIVVIIVKKKKVIALYSYDL